MLFCNLLSYEVILQKGQVICVKHAQTTLTATHLLLSNKMEEQKHPEATALTADTDRYTGDAHTSADRAKQHSLHTLT